LLFSVDQFLYDFFIKYPQRKKISEYKLQIKEQKKLSFFYGYLSKKQLKRYIVESNLSSGDFSKNLISLLERRLDIIVYRSQFVKNIATARQLITHKKILVNNKTISTPSYLVNPGDIISIQPEIHSYLISNRLNFLNYKAKKSSVNRAFAESLFFEWIQNKTLGSKKQLQFFTAFLVKKLLQRTSVSMYQNPFCFAENILKYNYFSIYQKPKMYKRNSLSEKKNLEYYRKFLRSCISALDLNDLQKDIIVLNLKKYLTPKVSSVQKIQNTSMSNVKPLHLEISYRMLQSIFLYSPQRISYPFLVNFDILQKAYFK